MRSPAIVFSVVAVSALSPSVLGSPLPAHSSVPATLEHRRSSTMAARGLGFLNDVFARADTPAAPASKPKVATVMGYSIGGRDFVEFWKKDDGVSRVNPPHAKRLDDGQTTGGNAHTGTAGAVDGGSVYTGDNGGMPTIMNLNSNNGGSGGGSSTGCASGGLGATGGNASSGDSGSATGGHVSGSGGMMNVDSNNAGDAGESASGCAEAGYSEGAGVNSGGVDPADTTA
ncbi:uncharacterized protein PHACADRAFT_24140 [Phanerochaete carnosa HHB-10118-sp]|uniref:Uncharacterized protein n=1 Tax=Phanerochaete carnosa (strain HHB-10118-sp) TaxID=650164 RepID=K5WNY1_PHACS|nr:uncharacterized protein PHACADRAFT_24140 [Phanerochaete carnosa HHB-10118-sp]EKM60909.1 hypothetical protein PHACADRAFT_24140 [Phanerochaete carnosa HHB-10118-sp]